ncbi:hypothetical protein Adt_18621 [Abeliophyllum distichum]|uniref:Uncharacterized protein n=1 Tax=Abeliophyllum distichum TaxID=126358 RepID=A0ABD1TJY5_9LAMI
MVASYLLWVVAEVGENLTPMEFESIYQPCRSTGSYNVSPRPGQKWGMTTDSPNKVHNWNKRFFFVDGDWEFMPDDPLPHVSIPRRFGELDYGKPPIPKRDQSELRSKLGKVRVLSSDFRSLSNLLKDDNLLASYGLMGSRGFLRSTSPGESYSAQAPLRAASGSSQEATVPSPLPSSSNLRIDPARPRDKGKRIVEDAGKAATQKRKAPMDAEGFMRDARKVKGTEEGRRSSPPPDGEPEEAGNSTSSAGQKSHFCISQRRDELSTSVMEMLPTHHAIIAVSVHKYWTQSWEKAVEEATVRKRLQLAEMNLARRFVLAKQLFEAFESFEAEEAKSKKLSEDLKAMGLEKAQLEYEKRAL